MAYDWDRLGSAIRDARSRTGMTQAQLAELAGVDASTIKNLEGRHRFTRWPKTIGAVEVALEKPEGWARAIAERRPVPGGEPAENTSGVSGAYDADTVEMSKLDLDDPVIKELLSSPFQREDMRWELIRLYLADAAELEARARRRAAIRALRRATTAGPASDSGIAKLLRLLEVEDTSQDSDDAGQGRSTA